MSIEALPVGTEDARRESFLELMGVPGMNGVYVLGSFARHATVRSQQVRALNLVDALCRSGRVSGSSRVAVVGAGISGLTAAAGFAVRGVAVDVLEQDAGTMRIQRSSKERALHPHIYDWPSLSAHGSSAALPLMNWHAGPADEVVQQLDEEWQAILDLDDASRASIEEFRSVGDIGLAAGRRSDPVLRLADGTEARYAVVVLAVGYGVEPPELLTPRYWTNDGLDSPENEGGRWLVSGAGDGALTDIMRLCILDFRHEQVFEAIDTHENRELAEALIERERGPTDDADAPPDPVADVKAVAGQMGLQFERRAKNEVWVNASEAELFSPSGSLLNRLVVAHLLNEGWCKVVKDSRRIADVTADGDQFVVTFEGTSEEERYDGAVLRHGPRPALEAAFPMVWRLAMGKRRQWLDTPQHSDWTRLPMYEAGDFAVGAVPELRVDFGEGFGALVVTTGTSSDKIEQRVAEVLASEKVQLELARYSGKQVTAYKPTVVSVDDLFSVDEGGPADDPAPRTYLYERALRAICEADLAVFDITDLHCGVMLLLGVRSVVRRGVTISVTTEEDPSDLPFNLRALRPLAVAGLAQDVTTQMRETIVEGFRRHAELPVSYLDLPAFDDVRELGSDVMSYQPVLPDREVLILQSYNAKFYEEDGGDAVQSAIISVFEGSRALRIVEADSPQLAEQRLYAAIRRDKLCVVDWTGGRANVFFELGVRMAVNPVDPVHLIADGYDHPDAGEGLDEVARLFRPGGYQLGDSLPLIDRLKRYREAEQDLEDYPVEDSRLSPGRTFQVIQEAIDVGVAVRGVPVHLELRRQAEALVGSDPFGDGTKPPLYTENPDVADEASRAGIQRLVAAWDHLGAEVARRQGDDQLVQRLNDERNKIGVFLRDTLRTVRGPEYEALEHEVKEWLRAAEPGARMAIDE